MLVLMPAVWQLICQQPGSSQQHSLLDLHWPDLSILQTFAFGAVLLRRHAMQCAAAADCQAACGNKLESAK